MFSKLYKYRFELFILSLCLILFGSLLFHVEDYENKVLPVFFIFNILTGILLISKNKLLSWIFMALLIYAVFIFSESMILKQPSRNYLFTRIIVYLIFYCSVTITLIKQIWDSKIVDKSVFLGLMSGYLSLGLIAFFMFLAIESSTPNSFNGLTESIVDGASFKNENLLYYSFITLLTIGFGEITPHTAIAQKASILTGLMGQFYIVIVTAVVIGKYISNPKKS